MKFALKIAITICLAGAAISPQSTQAIGVNDGDNLAQRRLDTWGVRDGLPPQPINSIAQTPDGFLWLATGSGLFRFDGNSFQKYGSMATANSTMENLTRLTVTRNGDLWVGGNWTGFGVVRADGYHRVQPKYGGWHEINAITQMQDGTVWAGGFGTDKIYHLSNGRVQSFPTVSDSIQDILDAGYGRAILLQVNNGPAIITSNGKISPIPLDKPLPVDSYVAMVRSNDGSLWIGTSNSGILRVKGRQVTVYNTRDGLPSNEVHCLYISRETTGSGSERIMA